MKVLAWLDEQLAQGEDVSQLEIPSELLYDDEADEVIFFEDLVVHFAQVAGIRTKFFSGTGPD